jgi:hypothetical protein
MQILKDEHYFYTLYRDETTDEYFLEVVCGTVAIFLLRIKMNKNEVAQFQKNPESVRVLADRIVYSPDSFLHRRL